MKRGLKTAMFSEDMVHEILKGAMNKIRSHFRKGFTMVELLVVMAIIGVLMTMASSVLRDAGKGRGIDSGVEMLESLMQEARATAMGNDTYTRLVIVNDPKDTSADSRHLRYIAVQMLRKRDGDTSDGTKVVVDGRWVSTSAGILLPPGVYFSPTYSRPLEWAQGSGDTMLGQTVARLSGRGQSRVFYVEFDEKGRFVSPMADPLNPTKPQRLVLINARIGKGRNSHDGIVPRNLDSRRRPADARGVVLWPNGDISSLRSTEQALD